MRLDHVSYVTSHDQLADTVQRLGSRLGITFVDGGIHPRFGTRNFTAPLPNRVWLKVDVQGYETPLLKGASDTLERVVAVKI